MEVKLLQAPENASELIYAAFRQCYSSAYVGEIWPDILAGKVSPQKQAELIQKVLRSGHTSPIEHVSFTFAIKGVSRALTHQLVRHRIASFSQQSQRYVSMESMPYVIPPEIEKNGRAYRLYVDLMDTIRAGYSRIQKTLREEGRSPEQANEDARFVLPNAVASKIVVTMNCRSLLNFFELRCCRRAQWEIRVLAWVMLHQVQAELPVVFEHAGPRCFRLGYCPEGDAFTCGKYGFGDARNDRAD